MEIYRLPTAGYVSAYKLLKNENRRLKQDVRFWVCATIAAPILTAIAFCLVLVL